MYRTIKHVIKFFFAKVKYHRLCKFDITNSISLKSKFEGKNKLYSNVYFDGHMGLGSYVASNSHIYGYIGRFTSIASYCNVIIGVHPYTFPYATTSPAFFSILKQNGMTFTHYQKFNELRFAKDEYPVVIGNDCWIGQSASIVSGVSIGDGAVVLAGAIVTKDVPPYAIVGGIPAKILRYRYDKETIDFLLKIKWWDNSINWFIENSSLLCNIDKLKEYYNYK